MNHSKPIDARGGGTRGARSQTDRSCPKAGGNTLPNSVFVEDAVVMFDRLAVITNPKAPARNPEIVATERYIRDLGLEVAAITDPATIDGGDVLKVGKRVYVGSTGSTNQAAVDQLTELLGPRGWEVIVVPVTKALHLKSAITALPDGTVIGYAPIVDDPSIFRAFLAVPEEPGAHVVVLDDDTLLMSSAAPDSAALFIDRGYNVVAVNISEFEKLEGCVTCHPTASPPTPPIARPTTEPFGTQSTATFCGAAL